ncbi:unnamed protein product [Ceratitis capitata]|uniref:(Mediterranean fruit fly) hypothetical protein n=1 Tax=Ceratitis capitata TaxID=7213 RepID=A0A811VA80_CERCA|nr:unnamed protein product [Ceratitis capitata]
MKIKSPKLRLRWKKWTKFDWKSQFDRTVSVKQGLIADEETLEAVTGGDDGTGGDGDEAKINKQITRRQLSDIEDSRWRHHRKAWKGNNFRLSVKGSKTRRLQCDESVPEELSGCG